LFVFFNYFFALTMARKKNVSTLLPLYWNVKLEKKYSNSWTGREKWFNFALVGKKISLTVKSQPLPPSLWKWLVPNRITKVL
jgi:hypothetical protein